MLLCRVAGGQEGIKGSAGRDQDGPRTGFKWPIFGDYPAMLRTRGAAESGAIESQEVIACIMRLQSVGQRKRFRNSGRNRVRGGYEWMGRGLGAGSLKIGKSGRESCAKRLPNWFGFRLGGNFSARSAEKFLGIR